MLTCVYVIGLMNTTFRLKKHCNHYDHGSSIWTPFPHHCPTVWGINCAVVDRLTWFLKRSFVFKKKELLPPPPPPSIKSSFPFHYSVPLFHFKRNLATAVASQYHGNLSALKTRPHDINRIANIFRMLSVTSDAYVLNAVSFKDPQSILQN